ncbi:UDP-glucose/GDP-mannose dehydrogenase family protein [bacterium]|nr:UDP-glucose/GDP-mannose dehydrogenase family protein [bacterium]
MKICVIGTGYVGLVAGTCLADMGNEVICVDSDEKKIEQLKNAVVPIYEPGLEELIKINTSEKRLIFSTDIKSAVEKSLVCFIAVGTPQGDDGSCDLSAVYSVADEIAKSINGYKLIIVKSTVPVGTGETIVERIKSQTKFDFDVVSNPEFLKQGSAVDDFLYPDRVIIGAESPRAIELLQEIYSTFFRTGNRVVIMDVKSAEMTKYTANAFLATKISFMNEISNMCEKIGADVEKVRIGVTTDPRIGNKFMFPGIGYGGSCFPKDVSALIALAEEYGCGNDILKAVQKTNHSQINVFLNKIYSHFSGDIKGKVFAVWGLSFKPKTNDMREAPSIKIIEKLLEKGAIIKAYDPKAMEGAKRIFKDRIEYMPSSYSAVEGVDALLLLTEWNEFRRPDYERIKNSMKTAVIFDGRNQYDENRLKQYGIKYYRMGYHTENLVNVK